MFLRNRLSKIMAIGLILTNISVIYTEKSFADDIDLNNLDENEKQERYVAQGWSPWQVKGKSNLGTAYGAWKFGVEGRGGSGAKLTLSRSYSVSDTLTGSIKAPVSSIDASVGFSTGKSFSRTATYTIDAPSSSKIYEIVVRNKYNKYKVNQERYYQVNGDIISKETAIAYANKFIGFGYDWSSRSV